MTETVTLYTVEHSHGRQPPQLLAVECKETAKRYVSNYSIKSWNFRSTIDKGDNRIHFTPEDAWAGFLLTQEAKRGYLDNEIAASDLNLATARATLAAKIGA